jgi:oligoribonuclease NrnB/cAMP/cGMP phosphodiesterase (DHH superfamily)
MYKKYNYVIYHKNCTDGFSGFIVLHKSGNIDNDAMILADVPSSKTVPQDINNKDIIIIDVAYNYNILKEIVKLAKSVVFIDHHITIKEDVEKIKKETNKNFTIIYDLYKSGGTLTWQFFYPNKKPPLFLRYIEDNDIGAWKLKNTRPFIAGLDVKFHKKPVIENIKQWDTLFDKKNVKMLIKRGKRYYEYIEHIVKLNSLRFSIENFPSKKVYEKHKDVFHKVGEYKVGVFCGGGCPTGSLLGNYAVNNMEVDFVIMWTYNIYKKEYILSFVSKKVDVGMIAKSLGGGGHTYAAACAIKTFKIDDMFN